MFALICSKNKKGLVGSYFFLCCLHFREHIFHLKTEQSAHMVIKTEQCTFFMEEKYVSLCISCGGFTNVTPYKHLVQSKSNNCICIIHYLRKQTITCNICEQWKENSFYQGSAVYFFSEKKCSSLMYLLQLFFSCCSSIFFFLKLI